MNEATGNSCRLQYVEIVTLTRDTDGLCTTECDSGDWSAEVKQENLPVVKVEPDDVCCVLVKFYINSFTVFISAFCSESLVMTHCCPPSVMHRP